MGKKIVDLMAKRNNCRFKDHFKFLAIIVATKNLALNVVQGKEVLRASNNPWDWLGEGIYFWEQSPKRALEYAIEAANKTQFHAGNIKTPFVIGAIIELGNCLNLLEPESMQVLKLAHEGLKKIYTQANLALPKNEKNNRKLDCAVFRHLHKSNAGKPQLDYDTIRCAFGEGDKIYEGANFTSRLHLQICVFNPEVITGYFLPRPLEKWNPYLLEKFVPQNQKMKLI